jgi:hypothetical protein
MTMIELIDPKSTSFTGICVAHDAGNAKYIEFVRRGNRGGRNSLQVSPA